MTTARINGRIFNDVCSMGFAPEFMVLPGTVHLNFKRWAHKLRAVTTSELPCRPSIMQVKPGGCDISACN